MKILLTILFILFSTPSWSYTFLNAVCGVSTNGTSVTTSAVDMTGATLFVFYNACNQSSCSGTQTDSTGSNTYTFKTGSFSVTASNGIYYVLNPTTSSSQTFTVTSQADPSVCVAAFSGTSSTVDKSNNNSASNSTTVTTGSVSPGSDNEVLVTGLSYNVAATSVSINSSFTIPSGGTGAFTSNGMGIAIAYLIQTTAGAVNPTWTSTLSGSSTVSSSILTVKAGATPVFTDVINGGNIVINGGNVVIN